MTGSTETTKALYLDDVVATLVHRRRSLVGGGCPVPPEVAWGLGQAQGSEGEVGGRGRVEVGLPVRRHGEPQSCNMESVVKSVVNENPNNNKRF